MIDTINELENIASEIDRTRDLTILLSDYFSDENLMNIKSKPENTKEEIKDKELLELCIYRRNFEEYSSLLYVIIDRLKDEIKQIDEVVKNNI